MRTTCRVLLAAIALMCYAATSRAAIQGGPHDFSVYTWSKGQICLPCHTPHNANVTAGAPLWNHDLTVASYTMYGGNSGTAAADLDQKSRLCMSCHDGTVAPDSFGGGAGTGVMPTAGVLGTDLRKNHPIGSAAIYPTSGDFIAKSYLDPATAKGRMTLQPLTIGTTSQLVVGCTTCHSAHSAGVQVAQTGTITTPDGRSVTGSGLCQTCHVK